MINLLQETLEMINYWGKTPQDVEWCGTRTRGYFNWDHFSHIANVEYDESYGDQNVYPNLVIVGKDWWLERHEYDGSEWWEYKTLPEKPEKEILVKSVLGENVFERINHETI